MEIASRTLAATESVGAPLFLRPNRFRSTAPRWCQWCLLASLLQGCGQSTYEERLAATADLYGYLGQVRSELTLPAWERLDLGQSLCLPSPFQRPLPGPQRVETSEGTAQWTADPRQGLLSVALPGLTEAWQADWGADGNTLGVARVFLLTNFDRLDAAAGGRSQPAEFLADVEEVLAGYFRVALPPGEVRDPTPNARYRLTAPAPRHPRAQYNRPKEYQAIHFVPGNGVEEGWLFERREGDLQAALLFVLPGPASPRQRERIELSLETWDIQPRRPGGAGGKKNSGGGASGF